MCTIGGFLKGVKKSAYLNKAEAMFDNVGTTLGGKISVYRQHRNFNQSGGISGGIATALKDHRQQCCLIPIQPNRSLPVHPAPHHTRFRYNSNYDNHDPKNDSDNRTINNNVINNIENTSNLRSESAKIGNIQEEEVAIVDEEVAIMEEESSRVEKIDDNEERTRDEEKAKIDEIENELMERMECFTRNSRGVQERGRKSKIPWDGSEINESLKRSVIDVSPERVIDLETPDPENLGIQVESTTSDFIFENLNIEIVQLEQPIGKRQRRRKKLKNRDESRIDNSENKTVPPLRLKKIRVREVEPKKRSEIRSNLESASKSEISRSSGKNLNHKNSSKYKIVSEPPRIEDPVAARAFYDSRTESLHTAKLKYKKSKLIVKLGQLRRKFIELREEMLRHSVQETTNGSRTKKESQIRQKLNRYKTQIENLKRLLNELPEVSSSCMETDIEDFFFYDERLLDESTFTDFKIISETETRDCGSRDCSPPLEPPKLSPKLPTSYDEMLKSPSQVRNSPPILPRAYVTITDCMSDYFVEKKLISTLGKEHLKKSKSLLPKKKSRPIESIEETITLTEDVNSPREDIEKLEEEVCDESSETKDVIFEDFEKKEIDLASMNSMDVLEIFEDTKIAIGETKHGSEEDFIINVDEPMLKRSASPLDVIIEKSSSESEEIKPELRIIDEAKVRVEMSDTFSPSNEKEETISKTEKEIVTLKDESSEDANADPIPICERFPTLANWIATLSKKQQVIQPDEKLSQVPVLIDKNGSFQVISPETVKTITQEVQQNDARLSSNNTKNTISGEWRNEPWQDSTVQQTQQPLLQPFVSPTVPPLPHRPAPPPINQDVCSPLAMAGFYARNYLDHYSMAYSYNPTIAAAASLWNSAAILQYPLMRPPSAILNTQQTRIPTNLEYLGGPINRAPYHRAPNKAKRAKLDNSANYGQRESTMKLHTAGLVNQAEPKKRMPTEYQACLTLSEQSRASSNPVSPQTTNYRNLLQQETAQQSHYSEVQARAAYDGEISGNWRTGHLLESVTRANYNYPDLNSWPTNPGSLLDSQSGTSAPTFIAPTSVLSPRVRILKPSVDSGFRNCNTPNLGKVLSNPNSTSNYECSNCGLANPMFKCLGCEVAFYCNENCQARHWNRHVKSCPKKMPKLKKVN